MSLQLSINQEYKPYYKTYTNSSKIFKAKCKYPIKTCYPIGYLPRNIIKLFALTSLWRFFCNGLLQQFSHLVMQAQFFFVSLAS